MALDGKERVRSTEDANASADELKDMVRGVLLRSANSIKLDLVRLGGGDHIGVIHE